MTVRVSVVTATYQDCEGLKATLESLRPLQISPPVAWEHVLVDSSPDATEPALAGLGREWPLKRLKSPPRGVYAAQNEGIVAARGEAIWFLNSGDLLASREALLAALDQLDRERLAELLWAGAELLRDGRAMYPRMPRKSLYQGILGANRVCHQAVIYRRSVFARVGDFSEGFRLAADYEHLLRCYAAGLRAAPLRRVLVRYDMGGRSADYRKVLPEFASIHAAMRPKLPAWMNAANRALLPLDRLRMGILKGLAGSPLSSLLRPLWIAWNGGKPWRR